MYGLDILCGISKGTFEIPHKIYYILLLYDVQSAPPPPPRDR